MKNTVWEYRTIDEPLPYTGAYDKEGNRWVKIIEGQKVLQYYLNSMDRLARARPPRGLLYKAVQRPLVKKV